jgi:hypothetical protein
VKAARILLDRPEPIQQSWCWRDDWITGFDSAFGLLAKFATLNVMGARELADVFIDRRCGQRSTILRSPNVDLRTGALFDHGQLATVLRLDVEQIRHAFLLETFSNRLRPSREMLRWCPKCANRAFHTPVFQLELVSACPVHGCALRSKCPRCRTEIPYRLRPELFTVTFACPSCKMDFAPALRDANTRSLQIRSSMTEWITNLVQLFKFEDEILPVKMELNRRRRTLGIGEAAFSPGDWRRIAAEYTTFITQALEDLAADTAGGQRSLPFSDLSRTLKRPSYRSNKLPTERRRRSRPPASPDSAQCSSYLKQGWDERLRAAYQVYSAVRRHLWRDVVSRHRGCAATAAAQMWWHMEGEKTKAFCPVAEAFLRWRMYWEGCGTPRLLFASMAKDPHGLSGWLSWGAPICPAGWTWESEQWVSDHVLGRTLLGSFREFLQIALRNHQRDKIVWDSHVLTGKYESYWAIAGKDTPLAPIRLYEQFHVPYRLRSLLDGHAGRSHRELNRMQVARIVR